MRPGHALPDHRRHHRAGVQGRRWPWPLNSAAAGADRQSVIYYTRKPNAPHYIYDKMVGGLVDMYVQLGSKEALDALSRITDWAVAHLDRGNVYAFSAGEGSTEWYTLVITLLQDKTEASRGRFLNVAGFEVLGEVR